MNFVKLTPIEQNGTPSIRRLPVNLDQVCLVLPGDRPGHTMLAMAGGMQLMVGHTELEIMELIEGKTIIEVDA